MHIYFRKYIERERDWCPSYVARMLSDCLQCQLCLSNCTYSYVCTYSYNFNSYFYLSLAYKYMYMYYSVLFLFTLCHFS